MFERGYYAPPLKMWASGAERGEPPYHRGSEAREEDSHPFLHDTSLSVSELAPVIALQVNLQSVYTKSPSGKPDRRNICGFKTRANPKLRTGSFCEGHLSPRAAS